ncbi:hypothetical protein ACFYWP_36755 [Actinacidiphila glaucinigra]|uniref:hypothetical protein n=1 Tax=Actinacidiphila glaucinigra TaxID=235986 RepID=UPI0036B4FE7B
MKLFLRAEAPARGCKEAPCDAFEAEVAAVMMTGVSADRKAKFFPWGPPTFRAIGKRACVPPL